MIRLIRVFLLVLLLAAAPAAHAMLMNFYTPLGMTGTQEVPPNASPASGNGLVAYDDVAHLLTVHMVWADLLAIPTASHVHVGGGPGTNGPVAVGFVGLPATTSGTYDHVFDLTDPGVYGGTFFANSGGTAAGAEAALSAGLFGNLAYMNIHNTIFPGGEIRGDLAPVPEPAPLVLLGLGLAAGAIALRRRAV